LATPYYPKPKVDEFMGPPDSAAPRPSFLDANAQANAGGLTNTPRFVPPALGMPEPQAPETITDRLGSIEAPSLAQTPQQFAGQKADDYHTRRLLARQRIAEKRGTLAPQVVPNTLDPTRPLGPRGRSAGVEGANVAVSRGSRQPITARSLDEATSPLDMMGFEGSELQPGVPFSVSDGFGGTEEYVFDPSNPTEPYQPVIFDGQNYATRDEFLQVEARNNQGLRKLLAEKRDLRSGPLARESGLRPEETAGRIRAINAELNDYLRGSQSSRAIDSEEPELPIQFHEASGTYWVRQEDGKLEQVKQDNSADQIRMKQEESQAKLKQQHDDFHFKQQQMKQEAELKRQIAQEDSDFDRGLKIAESLDLPVAQGVKIARGEMEVSPDLKNRQAERKREDARRSSIRKSAESIYTASQKNDDEPISMEAAVDMAFAIEDALDKKLGGDDTKDEPDIALPDQGDASMGTGFFQTPQAKAAPPEIIEILKKPVEEQNVAIAAAAKAEGISVQEWLIKALP
jgi:hypothetical protein